MEILTPWTGEILALGMLLVLNARVFWTRRTRQDALSALGPYQLLLEDGMYFLFGYDELADKGKGGERLFCLPRIKNIKSAQEKFSLPQNFEFASRCSGGRFGAFCEQKPVKYEIDFYGPARQYVKDCVWADDQKFSEIEEEDTTTIKFTTSQSAKVLEWVLAQGGNARPIAPKNFVELWKEEIRYMAKIAGIK